MPKSLEVPSASCAICNPSSHSRHEGSRCPLTRIETSIYPPFFQVCRALPSPCQEYSREAGVLTSPEFMIERVISHGVGESAGDRSSTTGRDENPRRDG